MTVAVPASFTLPVDGTPVLEAALMYVRAELAPVPLYGITAAGRCGCGMTDCDEKNWGKHPIGAGWQKRATLDPEAVRDRFLHHQGNIGIYLALGGYVLVDVDSEQGAATLESWGASSTLTAQTGRGEHRIYRLAPHHDASQVTDRRVAPGLDVKVRGQFAAAPSRHRTGRIYAWTHTMPPALLPDEVYGRIRKSTPPPRAIESPGSDLVRRARAYLAAIPAAISGARGHDQCFAAARALAGFVVKGLPEADAWCLLTEYNARCEPPWSERELEHKWDSAKGAHTVPAIADRPPPARPALRAIAGGASSSEPPGSEPDWRSELLWNESKNGNPKIVSHVENVIRVLQLEPAWRERLGFDEFASRVIVSEPPWDEYQRPTTTNDMWTDEDGTRLCAWLRRKFHRYAFCPSVTECDRAVDVVSRAHAFHPVRDYLESVSWDGTPRLKTWLVEHLGADASLYTEMVGRWWLISAVARIYRPGVMVRTVPILEGAQELRKSTALKALAGEKWVNDTPLDLGSKDAYQAIAGCWFVELAELDSLMRAEPSRAKAFFSSGIDRYRPPYGRRVVESPRQCIFVGTVNPPYEYLDDPSGGTRYHPIRCTRIDRDALEDARDQLWAEAVHEFQEGALWYPMTDPEKALLGEQQDDRAKQDAWTESIARWLKKNPVRRVQPIDLLEGALKLDARDQTKAAQTRIGIIMVQAFGWQRVRRREGNQRWYEYAALDSEQEVPT